MVFTVNTNISALQSYYSLKKINKELIKAQLRISSGKRINHVADDTSGFNIGTQLQAKSSVIKSQLNNIGSAKDYLSTAESALQQINDLFTKIKGKYSNSQNPTSDKTAIASDIRSLATEIDSIMKNTKFNGKNLLAESDGSTLTSTDTFGIGGSEFTVDFANSSYLNADDIKDKLDGGTTPDTGVSSYTGSQFNGTDTVDPYNVTVTATFSDGTSKSCPIQTSVVEALSKTAHDMVTSVLPNYLGINTTENGSDPYTITLTSQDPNKNIVSLTTTGTIDITGLLGITRESSGGNSSGGLLDSDTATVINAAKDVSTASNVVKKALGRIGSLTQTLDYRGDFLSTSLSTNASSISRIFDADIAEEQMKATRGNILNQVGTSMLSVLNSASQQVLSLFS